MAIYIEFTNLIHGGYNWELCNYLWSPTLATDGSKRWEIMKQVSVGDITFIQ